MIERYHPTPQTVRGRGDEERPIGYDTTRDLDPDDKARRAHDAPLDAGGILPASELGWFAGQRVQLVKGRIIDMSPQVNAHVRAVEAAQTILRRAFGREYWVRAQATLNLGPLDAPEPDVAVVPGTAAPLEARDPGPPATYAVTTTDGKQQTSRPVTVFFQKHA